MYLSTGIPGMRLRKEEQRKGNYKKTDSSVRRRIGIEFKIKECKAQNI